MASNTSLSFGDDHGYNIQVRGATATWQYSLSHGMAYMEQPLRPSDEIHLTFSGSGHVEVGVSYKDPRSVPDQNMDCKAIVNVRLRRRETKEVVRYGSFGEVKMVSVQHYDGKVDECPIEIKKPIWLMVNLKFGDVKAKIESSRGRVRFHPTKEENIKFIDSEHTIISTIAFNPGSLCFAKERIRCQEGLLFTVSPVKDSGTHSLPSNYFLKISYCCDNPAGHTKKVDYMSFDEDSMKDTLYDITTLGRSDCHDEEIHVGLTEGGFIHVRKTGLDTDYSVLQQKIDDRFCRSGIFIVFEPFRTMVMLSRIEKCHHKCTLPINPPVMSRPASYIKIVKRLDQIEHSMEHFEQEKSNVSKLIDGLENDVKEFEPPDDYLTPASVAIQNTDDGVSDNGEENATSESKKTMEMLYARIDRIEKRMEDESKRNSSLREDFQLYIMKIWNAVDKIENSKTSTSEQESGRKSPSAIKKLITKNAPIFVQALDLFPLCDYLLSKGVINMEKYSEFLEKSKQSRTDANRDFMMLLMTGVDQQPHIWECIIDAFKRTKQEHLLYEQAY